MNEVPSPELRISDLDREAALQALGEHMSVGRIDLDEYGDRSAKVTAVKTRGELAEIFADLPQPHPHLGDAPVQPSPAPAAQPAATPPAPAQPGQPMAWTDRPLNQRLTAAAIPLVWIAGIALFFTIGGWWWFMLPVAFTAVGRGLWGQDWHENQRRERHRHHHHDVRREIHRDRREMRDEWRNRRRDLGR